jgi:hypothetical protein
MDRQLRPIKELVDGLTDAEIEQIKENKITDGALNCEIVIEDDHKYLSIHYPPLT